MSSKSDKQIRKMASELPKIMRTPQVYRAMKRIYKQKGYEPLINFVLACRGGATVENIKQILS